MRPFLWLLLFVNVSCQPGEHLPNTKVLPKEPAPAAPTLIDRSLCGMPERIREQDWPRILVPTQRDEPDPPVAGTTTLVVLPDTQYYASCKERHLPLQGEWIAREARKRHIVATLLLGDLTEHNTADEWKYFSDALAPLYDEVPLVLTTGNHDHGDRGTANERRTLFGQYFAKPKPATAPTVARTMRPGDLENAYYRLPQNGFTLGILALEWSPRTKTVQWAKRVAQEFPSDRKIFITHAYLYNDSSRYDFAEKETKQKWNPLSYPTAKRDGEQPWSTENANSEGAHDGEMLWRDLLVDMPGLFLTLNGHVLGDGTGVLASEGYEGATVHQVLTNFQMLDEGGLGYLRLVELSPDGSSMRMKTYSPSLDQYATSDDQDFSLVIDPPLVSRPNSLISDDRATPRSSL